MGDPTEDTQSEVAPAAPADDPKETAEKEEMAPVKKKRGAERQLTKDDCSNDDDDDDVDDSNDLPNEETLRQPFPRASEEVLAKRKILKVHRPTTAGANTNRSSGTAAAAATTTTTTVDANGSGNSNSNNSSNPFANTSLTKPSTASSSSSPKIFGSGTVGGFGAASASTTSSGFVGFGTSSSGFAGFATATASGIHKPNGFATLAASSGDASTETSTSTSLFTTNSSSSKNPISFGFGQTSSASKDADDNDNNNNEEKESNTPTTSKLKILPEDFEQTTGEEGERKVYEGRCKSFKWVCQPEEENDAETDRLPSKTNPSVQPSTDFLNKQQTDAVSADKNNQDDNEPKQQQRQDTANTSSSSSPKESTCSLQDYKWAELGVGPIKLLQTLDAPETIRLVQRQETTANGPGHKVILNTKVYRESHVEHMGGSDKHIRLTTPGASGETECFSHKFKEALDAAKFLRQVQSMIQSSAKSRF